MRVGRPGLGLRCGSKHECALLALPGVGPGLVFAGVRPATWHCALAVRATEQWRPLLLHVAAPLGVRTFSGYSRALSYLSTVNCSIPKAATVRTCTQTHPQQRTHVLAGSNMVSPRGAAQLPFSCTCH